MLLLTEGEKKPESLAKYVSGLQLDDEIEDDLEPEPESSDSEGVRGG